MNDIRDSLLTRINSRLTYLIVLIASLLVPVTCLAEAATLVYIITTPGSDYQTRAANTLIEKLSSSGIHSTNIDASVLENKPADGNVIFVTFGGSTSGKVKQLYGDKPQLNITYNGEFIKQAVAHNHSSLVLTQPACRQISFMRKLVPAWKSAGIITSRKLSKQIDDIRQCATLHGLKLRTYHVDNESELVQKLDEAIMQNDVLLTLADTVVYNSRSVKTILLTAYRHRKPVLGYSNSLVEAGAVAAIYTSAEDAGMQAAEIIEGYIAARGCFDRSIYTPSTFTVSINHQVARALDIDLDEDTYINDDLDLLEIR